MGMASDEKDKAHFAISLGRARREEQESPVDSAREGQRTLRGVHQPLGVHWRSLALVLAGAREHDQFSILLSSLPHPTSAIKPAPNRTPQPPHLRILIQHIQPIQLADRSAARQLQFEAARANFTGLALGPRSAHA